MLSSTENNVIRYDDLIAFFRTKADATSAYYRKAIANLEAFLNNLPDDADFISEQTLADWFAYMYMRQLSWKTSVLYFNSISALYGTAVKEGLVSETDAFKSIKARIKGLDTGWAGVIDAAKLNKVIALTQNTSNMRGESNVAKDMLLYSLLAGCLKLVDVAMLKKSDGVGSAELDAIIQRNASARRKYVFDLHQSEYTTLQLSRFVDSSVTNLIHTKNLPWAGSADDSIECYWAYAALRNGVTGSEIVGYLGHAPKGIPVLRLCGQQELTAKRRQEIMHAVGRTFVISPMRWYALRLRPRVKFDELESRIGAQCGERSPELFYPMEEIARRIKKKIVMEKQPVIKNVVFFRCRVTDIFPFICIISDLAWCYTVTGKPGASYAAIPDSSLNQFQLAIGYYTSQYEAAICNPEIGTNVKVMSGMFEGIEASLLNVESIDGSNIFQLLYTGDNNMRWTFGVDARQAEAGR